jgi:hypothetical protein
MMHDSLLAYSRRHWRRLFLAGAALVLLFPLAAMQLSSDVNWSAGDFAAAALLLGGLGLALEATIRLVAGRGMRLLVGTAAIVACALIWAELAVGIF